MNEELKTLKEETKSLKDEVKYCSEQEIEMSEYSNAHGTLSIIILYYCL